MFTLFELRAAVMALCLIARSCTRPAITTRCFPTEKHHQRKKHRSLRSLKNNGCALKMVFSVFASVGLNHARGSFVARKRGVPTVGTSGFPRANMMLVPRKPDSCGILVFRHRYAKNTETSHHLPHRLCTKALGPREVL